MELAPLRQYRSNVAAHCCAASRPGKLRSSDDAEANSSTPLRPLPSKTTPRNSFSMDRDGLSSKHSLANSGLWMSIRIAASMQHVAGLKKSRNEYLTDSRVENSLQDLPPHHNNSISKGLLEKAISRSQDSCHRISFQTPTPHLRPTIEFVTKNAILTPHPKGQNVYA